MKYMTFNSSCSYAGLANMLEYKGINVEDYEIALEMKLPFFIERNEDGFVAGPSLQAKSWFDIYLNPHSFEIIEDWVDKEEMFVFLKRQDECMLGIAMRNGRLDHHAVVYTGMKRDKAVFMNNKHEGSADPDLFELTRDELTARLRDKTVVASLNPCNKRTPDIHPLLAQSIENLNRLQDEFIDFCSEPRTNGEILEKEFGLFRPILLDGPSMMKLLEQNAIYDDMRTLQKIFVSVAFKEKLDNVILAEHFDMDLFKSICDRWRTLIRHELETLVPVTNKIL
jgi:hypothetical protein